MPDLQIRKDGRAGRITLTRPRVLNALSWDMCRQIDAALVGWAEDPAVALVLIDAEGERAFCAGGDIQEVYDAGLRRDFRYGQEFWRDEYRMNARLFDYPKPVVSFLHGFTMGGGVGLGCHAAHRIVCDSSRIAMPEVTIGLVPDVGGSLILARAPGRLGEFLGLTGHRMGPGDAILAGFADHFIPDADWEALKTTLCATGDPQAIAQAAQAPPEAPLGAWQADIDAVFCGATLGDIHRALPAPRPEPIAHAEALMARNSPLAMAVALDLIRKVRLAGTIRAALEHEYRYTARSMEHGDVLEGIRARIIDRRSAPVWQHPGWHALSDADILRFSAPVTDPRLTFD